MDIFILIQKSDHQNLKQLLKQNPEVVLDAKFTFYGTHKSQNCQLSPLEYAILMQKPIAFGMIFQCMSNLLGSQFDPEPGLLQKIFYCSFNELQFIHIAKRNLDSSSHNPIAFLKAIPINIPNYNEYMKRIFSFLCNGNLMSKEIYKFNKIKTLKLILWMIQNVQIIVIDIQFSSCIINVARFNASGNVLSPGEALMLNEQLLKRAFEKEIIAKVQFAPFLETALVSGNYETIITCIKAGVDITQKNKQGFSFIHQLAMYGSPLLPEKFIDKIIKIFGGIKSLLANDFAVFHLVFEKHNFYMLEYFVKRGFNLFSFYSEYTHTTFADKLIDDLKSNRAYRYSILTTLENLDLLYKPEIWKNYTLRSAIEMSDWEIVRILLKTKRDPFEPDDSGLSPADVYQMCKPHFARDTLQEIQDLDKIFTVDLPVTKEYIRSKLKVALRDDYIAHYNDEQKEADEVAELDKSNFELASRYNAFMKKYHIVFRKPETLKRINLGRTNKEVDNTITSGIVNTDRKIRDEQIKKEKPVLALIKIFQSRSIIRWQDLKLIPAYQNFVRKIASCCKNPVLLRFQKISFQVDIFEFDLNAFFDKSDPHQPFFDDDKFLLSLNALISAMCGTGEVDLKQWASMPFYQNTVNRKALLWSLSTKQRSRYLVKGFDEIDLFNTKTISIGKFSFKMNDFTRKEDYAFLVHTTSGEPKNIAAMLCSKSNFINETPFFSASLVDPHTPFAKMMHQDKIIFPLCIILDVEDDAILKAYPQDAWSPQFSSYKTKAEFLENASKFLQEISDLNQHFAYHEYFVRTLTTPSVSQTLDWDSEGVYRTLQNDPQYDPGSFADQTEPRIPEISPLLTLNKTHQYYNEVIVAGRRKNKIVGILIEEADLKKFMEEYPKLEGEALKLANESLEILSKSPLPFFVVNTNVKDQLVNKLTERERRRRINNEFSRSLAETSELLLKQYRLLKSRENAQHSELPKNASTLSGSRREAMLISLEGELQANYQKLKDIRAKVRV